MNPKHQVLLRIPNPLFSTRKGGFRNVRNLLRISLTTRPAVMCKDLINPERLLKVRPAAWLFQVDLGNGAGYILGRSFFIGNHCRNDGSKSVSMYVDQPLRFGFTNNWNKLPWVSE